jgi:carbon-monoxide dehydrogenase medium subunit
MIASHPRLPEFDMIRPKSVEEASRFLVEHAHDARPFMGGTDVFVRMRDGLCKARYLVDVKHLQGMDQISSNWSGLTLGAAVTMNQVIASATLTETYPLLAQAARTVASYQLRNRATVVGNLCNASPAGDTTGACLVLDGSLQTYGPSGERRIPLSALFLGPGRTALEPGEIATALHLPIPPMGHVGVYRKLGRNAIGDLAIVGVTVLGFPDGNAASGMRFRLGLASVAPTPFVPEEAQSILAERPLTQASIRAAAEAAMLACAPIDDVRASAHYRRLMVRNLTRQALTEVWERLQTQAGRQL